MNYIYSAIAGALIAALGVWKFQEYRYESKISDIKYEMKEAADKAYKIAQDEHEKQIKQKDEALNEANKRAQANAAAAASSRNAADSLRQQLASARAKMPQASCEASRNYAAALSDVYGSCIQEYRSLAEKADGAISDIKTLEQAWP